MEAADRSPIRWIAIPTIIAVLVLLAIPLVLAVFESVGALEQFIISTGPTPT